ncbi:MAG: RNA methyltransferase [Pedobacter sp.]|nr:RNA methyltransferase [Pedobacter sp.]
MEIIRSRQNPLAKQLVKLAENRRERLKSRQTLLIGTHLVESALQAEWPLEKLLICEGEEQRLEIRQLLEQSNIPALLLDRALFEEIEQTPSTTGILALAALPENPAPQRQGFCLLLENVQDPGNVGSILRTAAAAGVDQVWLTAGCADVWSPKVLRAGMGAHFRLPLLERVSLDAVLADFAGAVAITTLEDATSLYQSDLRGDLVLALGSEGGGVSAELSARATQRLHIPMTDAVESLNVAAAAAICLFERRRQLAG